MKPISTLVVVFLLTFFLAKFVAARGMGGASHSATHSESHEGSHEGSYSGSHYSGSHEGSTSGGSYSGSHEGSYSGSHYSGSHEGSTSGGAYSGSREGAYKGPNYSGSHEESPTATAGAGGVTATSTEHRAGATEAGGYHVGSAEASGYHAGRVEANSYHAAAHVALPSDAGFGAASVGVHSTAYVGNHAVQPVSANVTAARGAAVRNSYSGVSTFDHGWYGAHPDAWHATGWSAGQAWHPATWSGVGTTLGLAAGAQPFAYDYGTNLTYQGNQVCSGGAPIATADQFYQQAVTIAQSVPPPAVQSADWTPLGIFALVQGDQDDPHYVMQLAVNKSGALGGNYFDLVSDANLPIHGSVDSKAQRVAWFVGNNKKNVGEAGLYNLTQGEAPALIHQGSDKTQQWLLVRLKQPEPANAAK